MPQVFVWFWHPLHINNFGISSKIQNNLFANVNKWMSESVLIFQNSSFEWKLFASMRRLTYLIKTRRFIFKLWNCCPIQDIWQNHCLCSRICEKHNGVTEVINVHSCVKYMISVSKFVFLFTFLQCVIESNYYVTVWVTHSAEYGWNLDKRLIMCLWIENILIEMKFLLELFMIFSMRIIFVSYKK